MTPHHSTPAADEHSPTRPLRANSHDRSEELEREISLLTELLRRERLRVAGYRDLPEWFVRVHQCLSDQPGWWGWLSAPRRRALQLRRLRRAGLFDGVFYLDHYPDVRDAGFDPLDHYMRHGIHEARIILPIAHVPSRD